MSMEIRYAAKGLISCDDRKFLFVAGERGMFNLPGGGIDTGELPKQALLREAGEEVKDLDSLITDPAELGAVEGPVTMSDGTQKMARWTVFHAALLVPSTELVIPTDSEITAIAAFTPQDCFDYDNMSDLAKEAMDLAT